MTGTSTNPDNAAAASSRPLTSREKWSARWRAFRQPLNEEKRQYLARRWAELPRELQTPNQVSGRHLTHCSFTLGASYCSFRCTHCYLPKNANEVPIPSLAEMREQIEANRKFQGPGGGLQITGGDVVDAYWRAGRTDELVEIVRHAYAVGLVPMVFTHGQTFIEQPEFLERLVVEGGLRQVSVHIDMTQAGRHGYPIGRVKSEADLHPVREAFTQLARDIRAKTGLPLEFAHSCTITARNIDGVPEIIRWLLADPERTHIWRMLSFQPEADTGRTIFSKKPITPADVWAKIQEGTGLKLRRDASIFGHPDCNSWTSLLVARPSGEYCTLLPDDLGFDAIFGQVLDQIGALSLVTDEAGTPPYRLLGVLLRNPLLTARLLARIARQVLSGAMPGEVLRAAMRGEVHTFGVGIHNFMDAGKVATAADDAVVKARLDSCVFKGAVKRNGEWEAVPMCSMNQQTWSEIYTERLTNPELANESQVPTPLRHEPELVGAEEPR
jgi:7,8-dihydro-6-hydroxymethylpterin dimethyltransferase